MNITFENDKRPNSPHRAILDHIPSGRMNAVTMRYLATVLGTDKRRIRLLIENARIDGNIIAGSNDGLFIPETDDELRDYINRSYSHIATSIKTLNPAIGLTGRSIQMILWGDDNV